jgi:hypothetical protein
VVRVGCKVPRVMKLGERDEAVGWDCRLDGAPVSPLQGGRSERGWAVQELKGVGVCGDGDGDGDDWCCLVLVEREKGKGMSNEGTGKRGKERLGAVWAQGWRGQVRFLDSREGARAVVLHAPCLAGASRVHAAAASLHVQHGRSTSVGDRSRHNMKTRHGHMFTLAVSVS